MKKYFCLLLTLIILICALSSCKEDTDNETTTQQTTSSVSTAETSGEYEYVEVTLTDSSGNFVAVGTTRVLKATTRAQTTSVDSQGNVYTEAPRTTATTTQPSFTSSTADSTGSQTKNSTTTAPKNSDNESTTLSTVERAEFITVAKNSVLKALNAQMIEFQYNLDWEITVNNGTVYLRAYIELTSNAYQYFNCRIDYNSKQTTFLEIDGKNYIG